MRRDASREVRARVVSTRTDTDSAKDLARGSLARVTVVVSTRTDTDLATVVGERYFIGGSHCRTLGIVDSSSE